MNVVPIRTASGLPLLLLKAVRANAMSMYPFGVYHRASFPMTECRIVHEQVHWFEQQRFGMAAPLWYVRYALRSWLWSGVIHRRPPHLWTDEQEAYYLQWKCEEQDYGMEMLPKEEWK